MSTELAPMQAFTERLKASLRDDVARMIPDEVLVQMIQGVIREEFFQGKVTQHNGGTRTTPPKFHAMIIDAIRPMIEKKANEAAAAAAPKIEAEMDRLIKDGVTNVMLAQLNTIFQQVWSNMGNNFGFQQAVEQALRNKGYMR